jgi:hypothetical protein
MDEKELFYEYDTCKHQQTVCNLLLEVSKKFIDRAMDHDASKLEEPERSHYIEPVYALNHEEVPYGSERYKELTAQMGKGWEHHKFTNDHHPEFFETPVSPDDTLGAMNLFAIMEMLCDWVAASKRRGNEPSEALKFLVKRIHIDDQVYLILLNTLNIIEKIK